MVPALGVFTFGWHRVRDVAHLLTVMQWPREPRLLLPLKRRPLEQLPGSRFTFTDPPANVDQRLARFPHPINILPPGQPVDSAGLAAEQPDGFGDGYFILHVIR